MGRTRTVRVSFRPSWAIISAALLLLSIPVQPAAFGASGERSGPRDYSRWSNDTLIVPWDEPTIQPSLASCPDGSVHVVWVDGREGQQKLFYKKLDAAGLEKIPDRKLTDIPIDGNCSLPKAISDRYGNLHVLWIGDNYAPSVPAGYGMKIFHLFFSSDGIGFSNLSANWFCFNSSGLPFQAPDVWAYRNMSAAIMPDGNLSVAFELAWSGMAYGPPPSSYPTIAWLKLAPNGTKLSESGLNLVVANNVTLGAQRNPGIAVGDDGRSHVFWIDDGQPPMSLLRWSVINESGPTPQGGLVVPGRLGAGPCVTRGPDDNITVFYLDTAEGAIRMKSYHASDSPISAPSRLVYKTDYGAAQNGSPEISPEYLTAAVLDRGGNLTVACEGRPAGTYSAPEVTPWCAGLFVVGKNGAASFVRPQFIHEGFSNQNGNPILPLQPVLFPALAANPQDELFFCWQVRFQPADPGRPMGLHLVRSEYNDLSVEDLKVFYNGSLPLDNDTMTVKANISNRGDRNAYDFLVSFQADGLSLKTLDLSLDAGATLPVSFNWTPARGNHSIAVLVDPMANPDADSPDNRALLWLYVFGPPDLSLTPGDISFSNDHPDSGTLVVITARVHDSGELVASAQVHFFVDDSFLATSDLQVLPSNSAPVNASWLAVSGNHTVRVEVANSTPPERDLTNNTASRVISVKEGPPVIPPEITITYPPPNAVVNGVVAVQGTASTVYPEEELRIECRAVGLPWEPADGGGLWTYLWDTTGVVDGIYTFEARASVKGASRTASVRVEVRNAVPPRLWFESFNPPGNASIFEGERAFFRADCRAEPAPSGPIFYEWTLDGRNAAADNGLGNYTYQSDFSSADEHVVRLRSSADFRAGPLNATLEWNLTVVDVDRPPVITALFPNEASVKFPSGAGPVFRVVASDPDGDKLSYAWFVDGEPLARSFGPELRPGGVGAGEHMLAVEVSDGKLNATASWNLTVTASAGSSVHTDILPCVSVVALAAVCAAWVVVIRRTRGKRKEQ
jgi:hypothetical protein